MTTDDITNLLASQNGISTSRVEMIISIVFEKIIEKLKEEGEVAISEFGSFKIGERYINQRPNEPEENISAEKYVIFKPDEYFLKTINT